MDVGARRVVQRHVGLDHELQRAGKNGPDDFGRCRAYLSWQLTRLSVG